VYHSTDWQFCISKIIIFVWVLDLQVVLGHGYITTRDIGHFQVRPILQMTVDLSLIQLVVPEPEVILITWMHVTLKLMFYMKCVVSMGAKNVFKLFIVFD